MSVPLSPSALPISAMVAVSLNDTMKAECLALNSAFGPDAVWNFAGVFSLPDRYAIAPARHAYHRGGRDRLPCGAESPEKSRASLHGRSACRAAGKRACRSARPPFVRPQGEDGLPPLRWAKATSASRSFHDRFANSFWR
jgi:hypothetical protein